MSRVYDYYIEKEQRKREEKEEALFNVPDQIEEVVSEVASRLDSIARSLNETLAKFHPAGSNSIFLSHRSIDKTKILLFKTVLRTIGFDPWLDEERMPAGTTLDRAILEGMKQSCAAVFFITPNFEDSQFLSQEIDYAIMEHRKRPSHFSIVPILMGNADEEIVPDLLRRFVAKRVNSDIEGLIEIIRGLPVKLGPPIWRF